MATADLVTAGANTLAAIVLTNSSGISQFL